MNDSILDIVGNNQFLLKLFPQGINKFAFGNLDIKVDDKIYINIHTSEEPKIPVGKWGVWNKNYNVIVIEIIGQFVKRMEINNLQNNKVTVCKFERTTDNSVYQLQFSGENWFVKLDLKSLTFQGCSTYLNDHLLE